MKIRSRSPKPNQHFTMSQCYIHANLVKIWQPVHEISCKQESVTPMPTPTLTSTGSAPKIICPLPLRWGDTNILKSMSHPFPTLHKINKNTIKFEPEHGKTNKMTCVHSEDSDQPVPPHSLVRFLTHAGRSLQSLTTHLVHSKASDQMWQMPRLIWVFAGCTSLFVGFVVLVLGLLIIYCKCMILQPKKKIKNMSFLKYQVSILSHVNSYGFKFIYEEKKNTFFFLQYY